MNALSPFYKLAQDALTQAGYDPMIPQGKEALYALVNLAAEPPVSLSPALFRSDKEYRRASWVKAKAWTRIRELLRRAKAAGVEDKHLASAVPNVKHGAMVYDSRAGWRLIPKSRAENAVAMEYRDAICTILRSAIFTADRRNRRKYLKRQPVVAASLHQN